MKIQKITSQHRRDFRAIYECEHCNDSYESSGYDDSNFHVNVIPAMKCEKCDKTAKDNYVPRQTKYSEHEVI